MTFSLPGLWLVQILFEADGLQSTSLVDHSRWKTLCMKFPGQTMNVGLVLLNATLQHAFRSTLPHFTSLSTLFRKNHMLCLGIVEIDYMYYRLHSRSASCLCAEMQAVANTLIEYIDVPDSIRPQSLESSVVFMSGCGRSGRVVCQQITSMIFGKKIHRRYHMFLFFVVVGIDFSESLREFDSSLCKRKEASSL